MHVAGALPCVYERKEGSRAESAKQQGGARSKAGDGMAVAAKDRLGRRTLHSEVVARLREMILEGELEPGKKIVEQDLCDRFEISRTPLREALKVLAAEGMVELLPRRGARVAMIDETELEELFPIIASLEALAGELACRRIDDAGVDAVRKLHERMVAAYAQGRHLAYSKLNRQIHQAIFTAAGNGALTTLYQTIEYRIRSIRHTARQTAEDWRAAVDDHERILHALQARDGALLAATLKAHIANTAEMVRHAMDASASGAQA